ncbi:MAG: Rossmann-like and DUF2520 domain-containing protein [Sarcina sp.]
MKFGFIGAGKLGVSLGKYFTSNDIRVSGYCSKRLESAKDASEFTNTKCYESLEELVLESDAIIISTSDLVIEEVWDDLKTLNIKGKIICHCSGVISSEVFSDIDSLGAYGYSIHPMLAISSKFDSYKNFSKAFFTVEGSMKYKYYFHNLFNKLGNEHCIIPSKNKAKYHLACVRSSNLILGILNKSITELMECGFTKEKAVDAILPLAELNIKNVKQKGLEESLTGPIERGDLETLKSHVDVLESEEDEVLYRLLSRETLKIALEKNKDRDYTEIINYLGE